MTDLQAALVTPLTGSLAGFGRDGAQALSLWAEHAASLPAPFDRVALEVHDTEPDPAQATARAADSRPHLIFGPYGSGPARAAARATDRLVWNHGGATSALSWGQHPNVVNVLSPASSYLSGPLELVRSVDPRARRVALVHGTTGFSQDVAEGARASARHLAFDVHDTPLPQGRGGDAARGVPDADVLLVAGRFEEELAAAHVLVDRSWPAAVFIGAGEEGVLAELGGRREGLLGPAQWVPQAGPDADEGPDAAWFVRRFTHAAGHPPTYPAAQAFATGVIAARALREAGQADEDALRAAAVDLSCTTLYGHFRLDPVTGLQAGHQVLVVQWQGGRREVVWPHPHVPVIYPATRARGEHP